jgi:hypothetical protein
MEPLKVKRLKDMSQLERNIMLMIWSDIQKSPHILDWRYYERDFSFENKDYVFKCNFKVQEGHLQLRNTRIEYATKTIELYH